MKAAIGYGVLRGMNQEKIAAAQGYDASTLRRKIRGEKSGDAFSLDEMHAIADLCGVPQAFMTHGWAALASDNAGVADYVVNAVNELRAEVMGLRADAPIQEPPGAVGRTAKGSRTTPERTPRKGSRRAAGKTRGGR